MNLLLTGCFDYSEFQKKQLEELGFKLLYIQNENDELPEEYFQVDAIVCNGLFLHHDINQFTNLKFIQLTSAGFDRVPMDIIAKRELQIFNARGVYGVPMAEWVLFRILEHYKEGWEFHKQQENGQWIKRRDLKEIHGTQVAIVGAGNIGREVGLRFQALGAVTVGFDIHRSQTSGFSKIELIETFHEKVREFDIVILTAPLLPSTKGLINEQILSELKEHAVLINIARGGLIDQMSLIRMLTKRKDIFAVLDVFEEEPLKPDSPLWKMENVAISPHNSFVGNGNNERMFNVIYNNLKSCFKL